MAYTVEFLETPEDMENIRARWEALYDANSEVSPYLSYEWFSAGLRHFCDFSKLRIGIVKEGNGVQGIVPLEIRSRRIGPFRIPYLRFALEGWPLCNGVLALKPELEIPVIEAVLRAANDRDPSWKYCRLSRVPAGWMERGTFSGGGDGTLLRDARAIGKSVVIEIPKSWEEYQGTLSKAHKKNISRRINAMRKKGEVRFVRWGLDREKEETRLDEMIRDAITVSRKSWQGSSTEGHAISDDDVVEFFREVSGNLALKGMLDLSVLYLDSCPISFCWGAARWPRSTINKLGFDPSLSEWSPGMVHLASLITDSIDRGFQEIDYGHEFFSYKRHWGKRYDELADAYIYPPGFDSRVIRWWRNHRYRKEVATGDLRMEEG